MKTDFTANLQVILDSISAIEEYTKGMTKEEFYQNRQKIDAVARRLEIISHAVRNIPNNICDKHPRIPWKEISEMHRVLAHEYLGVNVTHIWATITTKLSSIKYAVNKIKGNKLPDCCHSCGDADRMYQWKGHNYCKTCYDELSLGVIKEQNVHFCEGDCDGETDSNLNHDIIKLFEENPEK
jgi:uncharacterized protein with HEPN domain